MWENLVRPPDLEVQRRCEGILGREFWAGNSGSGILGRAEGSDVSGFKTPPSTGVFKMALSPGRH